MQELDPCPVCGAPAIYHNPKRANRYTYQVCCSRNPDHQDVCNEQGANCVINEWNDLCAARRTPC